MKRIIVFLSIIFAALLYIEYQTEVLKEADKPDSIEFAITQEQESVDFDIEAIAESIVAEYTQMRTAQDNTAVKTIVVTTVHKFVNFQQERNNKGVPIHRLLVTTEKTKSMGTYSNNNYNLISCSSHNETNSMQEVVLACNSLAIIGSMPRGPTCIVPVNNYT